MRRLVGSYLFIRAFNDRHGPAAQWFDLEEGARDRRMDWSALPDDFEDIGRDVFDEIRRVDCFALERDAEQERGQWRSLSSSPQRCASVMNGKEVHNSPEKSKHSDCKVVIDRMVQRQSQRFERAIRELRVDVERDVRRSAEMLSAIFFDQLGKPGLQGDATFVSRLLEIQQQQVSGRFARFQHAHGRQEAADLERLDNPFDQQQAQASQRTCK